MVRNAISVMILLAASFDIASAANTASRPSLDEIFKTTPRYEAFPVPSDAKSVWLLDTYTGQLTHCEATGTNTMPLCSPWAEPPGPNPAYRYDPKSQKMIPMNDAARQRDLHQQKSN
jgi:hypothetical protein